MNQPQQQEQKQQYGGEERRHDTHGEFKGDDRRKRLAGANSTGQEPKLLAPPQLKLVDLTRPRRGRPTVHSWPNFTALRRRRWRGIFIAKPTRLPQRICLRLPHRSIPWCLGKPKSLARSSKLTRPPTTPN